MPDFDTQTRQEPNEPNRPRSLSIAGRVRILLIAMRLRTLLIGGGILLFVVVAVPVGLLIYSSSGLATETVTCEQWMLGKTGECFAPGEGTTVEVCKAGGRHLVDSNTPCRQPPSSPPPYCTFSYCVSTLEECLEIEQAHSLPSQCSPSFLEKLRVKLAWAIWLVF